MLCYGTLALTVALAAAAPQPFSNVLKLDLSPEEAQMYLNQPPFTKPYLSGRTTELPLNRYNEPSFRSAVAGSSNGRYWQDGREIQNTNDYLDENVVSQFHGQDGLGAYTYGYRNPQSAKVESRLRAGNVHGEYAYKTVNNQLLKFRYWADELGFHQEDNLPKDRPQEEAEDVRRARLAHAKAWRQEAGAASRQQPDPQGEYYGNYDYQPEGSASEQQRTYAKPYQYDAQYAAQYGTQYGDQYNSQANQRASDYYFRPYRKQDEAEPTGPRGFFYKFSYPVFSIGSKSEFQGGSARTSYPVYYDTVAHGGLNYNI